ncbi:MAG TPA: hypothetical protein PL048_13020 [Leptospiraceae bacterium]|nr:hypothetical protein [Leptospiraceae bacterium]HNH07732.1 hypothetical protein [Leptospiraceae bacterium]
MNQEQIQFYRDMALSVYEMLAKAGDESDSKNADMLVRCAEFHMKAILSDIQNRDRYVLQSAKG